MKRAWLLLVVAALFFVGFAANVLEDDVQLGYKTRDAHRALAQVRAHVGTDADVPTLVRAVADFTRRNTHSAGDATDESPPSLATRALVQSGFSATLATHAVAQACAHVGTDDLATLIKEALRHCRDSSCPRGRRIRIDEPSPRREARR